MFGVRWKNASTLCRQGIGARRIVGSSFLATCVRPLAQRDCCTWKACMSTGNSDGQSSPGQVDEPPALQLRAVAEVGILGQRVVLPAAGVVDHPPPQDARGAVEVEEQPAAGAALRAPARSARRAASPALRSARCSRGSGSSSGFARRPRSGRRRSARCGSGNRRAGRSRRRRRR